MAGAVGAGGIGNVAIAYGFNRYNHDVTILATIIIILIIFAIQFLGDFLTKSLVINKKEPPGSFLLTRFFVQTFYSRLVQSRHQLGLR